MTILVFKFHSFFLPLLDQLNLLYLHHEKEAQVFPHDDQADDFRENYEDETEPPNITKTKESA